MAERFAVDRDHRAGHRLLTGTHRTATTIPSLEIEAATETELTSRNRLLPRRWDFLDLSTNVVGTVNFSV